MVDFDSWQSFQKFVETTTKKQRYIHDAETDRFLKALLETAKKDHTRRLSKGRSFWRAQRGYDGDRKDPVPYKAERMTPTLENSRDGRANPRGIPVLYLASDEETAIDEVQPWKDAYVSVAEFRTIDALRVVDCDTGCMIKDIWSDQGPNYEPSAEERAKSVWTEIDYAFAQPVPRDDPGIDYVPMQVIAEFFKVHGFQGIQCRSALGPGHNLILFDLEAAKPIGCRVFWVSQVKYEHQPMGKPVFYT